jgi:SAM-dependent methyltransferase
VEGAEEVIDAYRRDLAYIHDAAFGHFALAAAPVLLDALKQRRLKRGLVVDLGCGSGILSRAVFDAGYEALGIDVSGAMIALARQNAPRATFRQESILAAQIPPCVAVAAVGEGLNYLFDASHSHSRLRHLYGRIYRALAPGGCFLGDVAEPGRVRGKLQSKSFWEGDGWVVLVNATEDPRRRLLTREITSFCKVGHLYRRDHEVHQQTLLPRMELARELRRIGFRVRILKSYGSLRFGPGHAGFLARKPFPDSLKIGFRACENVASGVQGPP